VGAEDTLVVAGVICRRLACTAAARARKTSRYTAAKISTCGRKNITQEYAAAYWLARIVAGGCRFFASFVPFNPIQSKIYL